MLYFLNARGSTLVQLEPGKPLFTSTVRLTDPGELAAALVFDPGAKLGDRWPHEVNHPSNWAEAWDDAAFAKHDIYRVDEPATPEGEYLASVTAKLVKGAAVLAPVFAKVPVAVPHSVPKLHFLMALKDAGWLEGLQAHIATLPADDEMRLIYELEANIRHGGVFATRLSAELMIPWVFIDQAFIAAEARRVAAEG